MQRCMIFSCSLMCFEGENSLWSKPKLTNDLFNSGEFIIIIMQIILRLHSLHYFKAERVVSLSHLNHHVPCRVWILEIREHIWDSIEANHKNLWRAWKCVHFHTDTHTHILSLCSVSSIWETVIQKERWYCRTSCFSFSVPYTEVRYKRGREQVKTEEQAECRWKYQVSTPGELNTGAVGVLHTTVSASKVL